MRYIMAEDKHELFSIEGWFSVRLVKEFEDFNVLSPFTVLLCIIPVVDVIMSREISGGSQKRRLEVLLNSIA